MKLYLLLLLLVLVAQIFARGYIYEMSDDDEDSEEDEDEGSAQLPQETQPTQAPGAGGTTTSTDDGSASLPTDYQNNDDGSTGTPQDDGFKQEDIKPTQATSTVAINTDDANVNSQFDPSITQQQASGNGCFATFQTNFKNGKSATAYVKAYEDLKKCLTGKCSFDKCNGPLHSCMNGKTTANDQYQCYYFWYNCVTNIPECKQQL